MSIVAISKGGTPSSFVDLSERKKVLCKEIEHLRWIKGQLEAAHEKTVAYLQKQQNEWDEKNGALQTRNKVSQIRNHLLKKRVTYLSREFNAHRCPPFTPMGVAWKLVFNPLREEHRRIYPKASPEEFLFFLGYK